jgi:hypothetical protein
VSIFSFSFLLFPLFFLFYLFLSPVSPFLPLKVLLSFHFYLHMSLLLGLSSLLSFPCPPPSSSFS